MKQREIKFRAWIPSIKKMGMAWDMHKELTTVMDSTHDVFPYEAIFMQFTGLFDKNGKEIYEGDIVKYETYFSNTEVIREVEWSDGITGFDPFADYDADCDIYVRGKDVEVIGNIYENPELMKS